MADEYRMQRIERLLQELKYEITRGMMEGEIEEQLSFRFVVPVSKHFHAGVVECEFRARPTPHVPDFDEPRLKAVKPT